MPAVIYNTDTTLTIYRIASNKTIGSRSLYASSPHPATNKKIEGWKWDQRLWPTKNELQAIAYAPSLWDPEVSGLESTDYQSGVGDNNDLLLLDVEQVITNDIHHWAPKIRHGYFYVGDKEWYLYADQFLTEFFAETTVSGTHQILDLSHHPKPTIPIQVRRYRFDRTNNQYAVDLEVRRKVEFTVSGALPEYIVDTTFSPPRLELNNIWTKQIANPVSVLPDDINVLELVGISTGN